MNIQNLKTFRMVARKRNIIAAADALLYDPATVMLHLKQLEADWGVRLVERDGKDIKLTRAGNALLVQVEALLDQMNVLQKSVGDVAQHETPVLRIGAVEPVASVTLPPLIGRMFRYYPDTQIHVETASTETLAKLVRAGHLDVAIGEMPEDQEMLYFEPLYVQEFKLLLAHRHPLARQVEIHSSDLAHYPLFSTQKLRHGMEGSLITPPTMIGELVKAGLGIGIYPVEASLPLGTRVRECADLRFEVVMGVMRSQEQVVTSPALVDFLASLKGLEAILQFPTPLARNAPPHHLYHTQAPDNFLLLRGAVGLCQ